MYRIVVTVTNTDELRRIIRIADRYAVDYALAGKQIILSLQDAATLVIIARELEKLDDKL
jgi:hypothetical protein